MMTTAPLSLLAINPSQYSLNKQLERSQFYPATPAMAHGGGVVNEKQAVVGDANHPAYIGQRSS